MLYYNNTGTSEDSVGKDTARNYSRLEIALLERLTRYIETSKTDEALKVIAGRITALENYLKDTE